MTELLNRFRSSFAQLTRKSATAAAPAAPAAPTVPNEPLEAAPHTPKSDFLREKLLALLNNIAAGTSAPATAFDPEVMATALRKRIEGLELNLGKLTTEEAACFGTFSVDDWRDVQAIARRRGGVGIAYVELDAQDFDTFLPALRDGFALDCVSVWLPAGVDAIDVEGLQEGGRPRVNFLHREETAAVLPCVADKELVRTLVDLLNDPAMHVDVNDAEGVVNDILGCAAHDGAGEFGFDFMRLPAHSVRALQALPESGWKALQASATRSGTGIAWLVLPDKISLNKLVARLRKLSPLSRLSVAAPAGGAVMPLGKLQGAGVLLKELVVRKPNKKLGIHLPHTVKTVRAEGGTGAWQQSKMTYFRDDGTMEREACDWQPRIPTKV